MKKYSTIDEKRNKLLKGLQVKPEVYVNSRQEKRRRKEKERLHKNFHKTINGR